MAQKNRLKFLYIVKNRFGMFACACGNKKTIRIDHFKSGATKSCGCLNKEIASKNALKRNITHGLSKTLAYQSWSSMMARCYDVKNIKYKSYGMRGILVCDRWHSFINFYSDMGERPKEKSLDRIDNNLGYNKENCRWAERLIQANNTRTNKYLNDFDKNKITIADASRKYKVEYSFLYRQLKKNNFNLIKVLTTQNKMRGYKNGRYKL